MKILIVTDLYPLDNLHKGIPLAIENFALALKDLGHEIFVLRADLIINTLLRGRKIYAQGTYEHNGIKIYNQNFVTPFYTNPKIKDIDFDVIISHMPSGTLCAAKIKKKLKKPFMAVVHSSDLEVLKKYKLYFSKKLKNAYALADTVAARSMWIKNELKNYTNKEIALAPSGIKKEEISDKKEVLKKFEDIKTFEIVCTSSLIKRKNLFVLVEAMKNLKNQNVNLKIFGTGKLEKKLKQAALGANIEFMGQKTRKEILETLSKSHIFILPSIRETFGLSYLEALAKGCITICSKNSGISGYIKNGVNGYIIEPKKENIENLINKILKKDKDELKKISLNALDLASDLEYYKCAKKYIENIKKFCK